MMSYQSRESVPKWIAYFAMFAGVVTPYIMAAFLLFYLLYGLMGLLLGELYSDIIGLISAAITVPLITAIVLPIAYVWFLKPYWRDDVNKTELSPILLLVIFGYPIAFAMSLNSSLGIYFIGAALIASLLAAVYYKWEPRVPSSEGIKFGLTWSAIMTIVVLLVFGGLDYFRFKNPLAIFTEPFLNPREWFEMTVAPATTLGIMLPYLKYIPTLQIIPTAAFMALVVGFSEEAWARLTIPQLAKYLDGNIPLSVWWLAITWLSLHAPVIALDYALLGLFVGIGTIMFFLVPLNIFILGLISIFIFYVFAKTGDYISAAFAHGFYDMMVSLGGIGLIIAIIFLIAFHKFSVD